MTYSFVAAICPLNGDDARLVEYDALVPNVYQRVRRTEVDRDIIAEEFEKRHLNMVRENRLVKPARLIAQYKPVRPSREYELTIKVNA